MSAVSTSAVYETRATRRDVSDGERVPSPRARRRRVGGARARPPGRGSGWSSRARSVGARRRRWRARRGRVAGEARAGALDEELDRVVDDLGQPAPQEIAQLAGELEVDARVVQLRARDRAASGSARATCRRRRSARTRRPGARRAGPAGGPRIIAASSSRSTTRGRSSDHGAVSVASMPSHSATVRAGRSPLHEVADRDEREAAVAQLGDQARAARGARRGTPRRGRSWPGFGSSPSDWYQRIVRAGQAAALGELRRGERRLVRAAGGGSASSVATRGSQPHAAVTFTVTTVKNILTVGTASVPMGA